MMLELLASTADALRISVSNLLIPAIIFFLLSLLIKGGEVVLAIRRCFSNSMVNILLMSLNVVAVSPIALLIAQWMQSYELPFFAKVFWDPFPEMFIILCAVFCGDFIGYWRHRLEHSRFLWPSHVVHHSDTQMTWLTLQRLHPFNFLSTYIIDTSLLLALGFPPYAIIANNFVRHYYGYFIHADLPWTYGLWGGIFVSPVMHRWHHAVESSAHNTNFATVFSIFDRVFGTYRVPGLCDGSLGVSYDVGRGFFGQLFYPFRLASYKRMRSRPGKQSRADA